MGRKKAQNAQNKDHPRRKQWGIVGGPKAREHTSLGRSEAKAQVMVRQLVQG